MPKEIISSKNYTKKYVKNVIWKLAPFVMKFLRQSPYVTYVSAKLLKLVQISILASSDFFLLRIL